MSLPEKTAEIKKRHWLITTLCIINYLWVLVLFPSVTNPALKQFGDLIPPLYGIIVALTFISVVGVWHLRRWGVNLYISIFFIKEIFLVYINDVSYIGIFFSLLSIVFFMLHYKRMGGGL